MIPPSTSQKNSLHSAPPRPSQASTSLLSATQTTMGSLWTTSLSGMSVPMRDTVEEEKVRDYLCLVSQILGASSLCFPRSTSKTNAYSLNRRNCTVQRSNLGPLQSWALLQHCSGHGLPHPCPPLASLMCIHVRCVSPPPHIPQHQIRLGTHGIQGS